MLLDTALAFHRAGYCVVPVRADGSKAPASFWKQYQAERPTEEQLRAWFTSGAYDGIGLVCGAVSGNLELLELEGRAMSGGYYQRFRDALADHGLAGLADRITAGYAEATPSGGLHLLVRVDGAARPNTKLARRPSTPDELLAWKAEQQAKVDAETDPQIQANRQQTLDRITRGEQVPVVLVETRGEGGFVVVAPSAGRTHPTGKPWTLLGGGPDTIVTITEDERDALYAIATLLDEMPTADPAPRPAAGPHDTTHDDGLRPGDDFNRRATWEDILGPHGWTPVRAFGTARAWRRPGKSRGISATTGRNEADNLFVFSSSTVFEQEVPYSKFGAYAVLEHGGDHAAAARELRRQGYGTPLPRDDDGIEDMIAGFDGNLATVHRIRPDEDAQADVDTRPRLQVVQERTHRYSDDRNAQALVARFGDVIRYCPDRSTWLAWDGQRWQWCEKGGGTVAEYAKQVARSLPEDTKPDSKYKQASLSARGISACLTLARSDPRIVVRYAELDARLLELNTPGGIVDLETGALRPADPASLHTRMTAITPDPDADPGRWEEFLRDTFGDDQALIAFMQRMVGYSAVGVIGPHVLPFCYGTGGNGKGVFLEALTGVLGDYAGKAPRGFLTVKSYDPHPQEIAKLAGLRMVLASETNEDDRFDEAKLKELTGGDTLTGHFMRENDFSFQPTHTLWLMGNNKPEVATGGRSFWRRLRLIPFEQEVPEEKVVDDLQGLLIRDHGPALLAWIVRGAVAYGRTGLAEPDSVRAATAAYQREQDTVKQFVEERCLIGGGEHVTLKKSIVYEAYERWCRGDGLHPVTKNMLTRRLKGYNVGEDRSGKGRDRAYTNIALLPSEDDEDRNLESWIK